MKSFIHKFNIKYKKISCLGVAGYEDGRIYEEIFISFPTDRYILKYPYELCIYKL